MSDWPEFFGHDTPPDGSTPASGSVYRIVKQLPPKPTDFKSYVELYPEKDFGAKRWQACGVSFHQDYSDSEKIYQRYPGFKKNAVIVMGDLLTAWGLMKATPSGNERSHLTVWFRSDAEPHTGNWK